MRRALAAALLAAALPVPAQEWGGPYTERPLDFSVRFARQELELERAGARIDSTLDRVGIAWRERFGERLRLGLFLDYASLTQENRPLTAGLELTGYYAGVSLDADLARLGPAALFLQASLAYLRLDDDTPDQSIVLSWTEPAARLGLRAPLGGRLRGYAGVRYGVIDGEERLRGSTNETRSLAEEDRVGGFAGLELALERDGYIGVTAASGPDRTVGIYFGRDF